MILASDNWPSNWKVPVSILIEGPSVKRAQVTICPLELKFPQKRSTLAYKSVILESQIFESQNSFLAISTSPKSTLHRGKGGGGGEGAVTVKECGR